MIELSWTAKRSVSSEVSSSFPSSAILDTSVLVIGIRSSVGASNKATIIESVRPAIKVANFLRRHHRRFPLRMKRESGGNLAPPQRNCSSVQAPSVATPLYGSAACLQRGAATEGRPYKTRNDFSSRPVNGSLDAVASASYNPMLQWANKKDIIRVRTYATFSWNNHGV